MSTIIDRINEDYEDYIHLCKELGEKPKNIMDGFLDHKEQLETKNKEAK